MGERYYGSAAARVAEPAPVEPPSSCSALYIATQGARSQLNSLFIITKPEFGFTTQSLSMLTAINTDFGCDLQPK